MAMVIWSEDYAVGVADLDREHVVLFSLVNHLYDALESAAGADVVERLLDALVDSAREHFRHEEEVLQSAGYALLDEHRLEHEHLFNQMLAVRREVARHVADGVATDVGNLSRVWLMSWLTAHIQGDDRLYGAFLGQVPRESVADCALPAG